MKTTTHRYSGHAAKAAFALFIALSSAGAMADESPDAFTMTAIEPEAAGELVTAGRYAEAIEQITSRRATSFVMQNNLCVAYAKSKAVTEAFAACEAALNVRRTVTAPTYLYSTVIAKKQRDRAIALSNRGVLRAVTGDVDGARADFEESLELYSTFDAAEANLAQLQKRLTAAM